MEDGLLEGADQVLDVHAVVSVPSYYIRNNRQHKAYLVVRNKIQQEIPLEVKQMHLCVRRACSC